VLSSIDSPTVNHAFLFISAPPRSSSSVLLLRP